MADTRAKRGSLCRQHRAQPCDPRREHLFVTDGVGHHVPHARQPQQGDTTRQARSPTTSTTPVDGGWHTRDAGATDVNHRCFTFVLHFRHPLVHHPVDHSVIHSCFTPRSTRRTLVNWRARNRSITRRSLRRRRVIGCAVDPLPVRVGLQRDASSTCRRPAGQSCRPSAIRCAVANQMPSSSGAKPNDWNQRRRSSILSSRSGCIDTSSRVGRRVTMS